MIVKFKQTGQNGVFFSFFSRKRDKVARSQRILLQWSWKHSPKRLTKLLVSYFTNFNTLYSKVYIHCVEFWTFTRGTFCGRMKPTFTLMDRWVPTIVAWGREKIRTRWTSNPFKIRKWLYSSGSLPYFLSDHILIRSDPSRTSHRFS